MTDWRKYGRDADGQYLSRQMFEQLKPEDKVYNAQGDWITKEQSNELKAKEQGVTKTEDKVFDAVSNTSKSLDLFTDQNKYEYDPDNINSVNSISLSAIAVRNEDSELIKRLKDDGNFNDHPFYHSKKSGYGQQEGEKWSHNFVAKVVNVQKNVNNDGLDRVIIQHYNEHSGYWTDAAYWVDSAGMMDEDYTLHELNVGDYIHGEFALNVLYIGDKIDRDEAEKRLPKDVSSATWDREPTRSKRHWDYEGD